MAKKKNTLAKETTEMEKSDEILTVEKKSKKDKVSKSKQPVSQYQKLQA